MADRIVAVTVLLPGTPGTDRSARLTSQVTVAVTWAAVPTGAANPVVSTDTAVLAQVSPWLASVELAAEDAATSASAWVREIDAERAALLAAASTAWCAMAILPAKLISATKSRNAGTPIT